MVQSVNGQAMLRAQGRAQGRRASIHALSQGRLARGDAMDGFWPLESISAIVTPWSGFVGGLASSVVWRRRWSGFVVRFASSFVTAHTACDP
jgi:hypothetical protein